MIINGDKENWCSSVNKNWLELILPTQRQIFRNYNILQLTRAD